MKRLAQPEHRPRQLADLQPALACPEMQPLRVLLQILEVMLQEFRG